VDDHHGVLTSSLHGVTWVVVYKKMETIEWNEVASWTHTVDGSTGDRQARRTELSMMRRPILLIALIYIDHIFRVLFEVGGHSNKWSRRGEDRGGNEW